MFPPVSSSVISLCIFYSLKSYTFFSKESYIAYRSLRSSFLSWILPSNRALLPSRSLSSFLRGRASRGFSFKVLLKRTGESMGSVGLGVRNSRSSTSLVTS